MASSSQTRDEIRETLKTKKKSPKMNWGVVVVGAGALIIANQAYLLVGNGYMFMRLQERFPSQPTAVVAGILSVCAACRFLAGELPLPLTVMLLVANLANTK